MSKSQLMSDTQIKALIATIIHKPDHPRDYCRIFFPMKFPGLNRASPQISFVFHAEQTGPDAFKWVFSEVEIIKAVAPKKVTK